MANISAIILANVQLQIGRVGKSDQWADSAESITRDIVTFSEQITNITGIRSRARTLMLAMAEDVSRFEGNELVSRATVWAIGHQAAINAMKSVGIREARELSGETEETMRLLRDRRITTPQNEASLETIVRETLGMYDRSLRRGGFRDGNDTRSVRLGEFDE